MKTVCQLICVMIGMSMLMLGCEKQTREKPAAPAAPKAMEMEMEMEMPADIPEMSEEEMGVIEEEVPAMGEEEMGVTEEDAEQELDRMQQEIEAEE